MNEKSIEEMLAEKQIKEFNNSKFGQFFNSQKLKEQELTYLQNLPSNYSTIESIIPYVIKNI